MWLNREYKKKKAHRDATLFLIYCEGAKREAQYFKYFEGRSSQIQIEINTNPSQSAPKALLQRALERKKQKAIRPNDSVWFVVDTDRWGAQLRELHQECSTRKNWSVAQSNPCFEVWLARHFSKQAPRNNEERCSAWKAYTASLTSGGFDSKRHPQFLLTAISNAKNNAQRTGFEPHVGNTDLWKLGEALALKLQTEDGLTLG